MSSRRSVLVIGANGYIGSAVARAFVRAGWRVYGFVRRPEAARNLACEEVTPIVGSLSDLSFLDALLRYTNTINVVANCTEPPNYIPHFHQCVAAIRRVAEISNQNGVRPLVLWTSGCKDYGTTAVDGTPGLSPHTEISVVNPQALIRARATYSLKILEHDLFDAAVLRPTNVYGYSSSYYGAIFDWAARTAAGGSQILKLTNVDPRSIMHSMHVDDCGEAYVALAEHSDRTAVSGTCFNISAHAYETADVVLRALAREFSFAGGAEFVTAQNSDELTPESTTMGWLFGHSQWVASQKIRDLTGWSDRRMLFSENLGVYRTAYEAVANAGHEDVARVKDRVGMWQRQIDVMSSLRNT
ncbi:hypothetical protein BJ170DRAFT_681179 [Xylariales sp. AK1849]|nr:hypothetical protein BJ170DRAFT_681179 [Xylariales sp. AK1849]